MNPTLIACGENGTNIDGLKKFETIFDMFLLSQHHAEEQGDFIPYFEYIAAVLDLYGALCAGRNTSIVTAMRERIGLTNKVIIGMIEDETKELNNYNAHPILKNAFR